MAKPVKLDSVVVDLDLDALRPPGRTFRFREAVYTIPALLPMPTIIAAIQLQDRQRENARQIARMIADVEKAAEAKDEEAFAKATEKYEDAETEQARILSELYVLVMDLLRDLTPDLPDLRINPEEVQGILSLAMGSKLPTVEEAVADTLGETSETEGEDGSPPTEPKPDAAAEKKPPSRSRRRSPARS